MRVSQVVTAGRPADPPGHCPGRISGGPEPESFSAALGNAHPGETTRAGQADGEPPLSRHRDIAAITASARVAMPDRTGTARAADAIPRQVPTDPYPPPGPYNNAPGETRAMLDALLNALPDATGSLHSSHASANAGGLAWHAPAPTTALSASNLRAGDPATQAPPPPWAATGGAQAAAVGAASNVATLDRIPNASPPEARPVTKPAATAGAGFAEAAPRGAERRGATGSNPTSTDRASRDTTQPQISVADPAAAPDPASNSQAAGSIHSGTSAAAPSLPGMHLVTGAATADDDFADTAPLEAGPSGADCRSATGSNPTSTDRASRDTTRPQISVADPTAAPDRASRSQAAGSIHSGTSAAASSPPGMHLATGATTPGTGLAGAADPTIDHPAIAETGSGDAARLMVAATNVPPPASGVAAALPVEKSSATAASLSLADLPDQLFRHVVGSTGNPGDEIVLHLHPPELGDVTVRMLVTGREVSAWFGTPEAEVQQVISQALGQLHAGLGNAGYTLGSAWVGADASATRERGGRAAIPPRSAQKALIEPKPMPSPAAARPILSSGSGVSIYV